MAFVYDRPRLLLNPTPLSMPAGYLDPTDDAAADLLKKDDLRAGPLSPELPESLCGSGLDLVVLVELRRGGDVAAR